MSKPYKVFDIIQSILWRKEYYTTGQKELLQCPRVTREAKTLGKVSSARCDDTLRIFNLCQIQTAFYSTSVSKMIVLLPLTLRVGLIHK